MMSNSHFRRIGLLLAGVFLCMGLSAQELRIGYVNTERISNEAATAKLAQQKLQQEFSKREKELVELGNTVKALADKFEREAPTLAESQRALRQKQLLDQDREFQRKRREFQEDLAVRKNEELQAVLERATKVIQQVAEAEKIDLVLQEAVYVNPRLNITDKVLKILNAPAPK